MSEAAIDTLTIVRRLQAAGFDGTQAEAVTFAIRDGLTGDLASKEDIANLRGDVKDDVANLRSELKEDIAHLDGKIMALDGRIMALDAKIEAQSQRLEGMVEAQGERLEGKIMALDARIEAQGERLEGKIEAQGERFDGKFTLLYWMLGVLVAGVASLVIRAFLA